MQFSEEYPNKPPVVKFKSAMFHPNSCVYVRFPFLCRKTRPQQVSPPPTAHAPPVIPPRPKKTRKKTVYADGAICLDILQNQWSPIYDVSAVLTSIQSLLCDPNPNSPANSEAARLYGDDRREYDRRVRGAVEASLMQEETAAGAGAAGKKRPASAAAGAAAAASGGAPSVKKERKVEAAAAAAAPAPAPAAEKKEAEATKAQEEAEVTPATEAKAEAAAAPAAAPAAAKAEAAAAAAAPPPAGA